MVVAKRFKAEIVLTWKGDRLESCQCTVNLKKEIICDLSQIGGS